jgi:hypothetical protein
MNELSGVMLSIWFEKSYLQFTQWVPMGNPCTALISSHLEDENAFNFFYDFFCAS